MKTTTANLPIKQSTIHNPVQTIQQLLTRPKYVNSRRALDLAIRLHDGQERLAGGPYIHHPARVALKLHRLGVHDDKIIAAALLHDVIEDCIDRLTGDAFAQLASLHNYTLTLVEILTQDPTTTDKDYYALIHTSPDASLIKLADRLDNLTNIKGTETSSEIRTKLRETRQYVLPLATTHNQTPTLYVPAMASLERELQQRINKLTLEFGLDPGWHGVSVP
jgi:(p)ppGpp synthase/HD superfamily hydrolase